MDFRQRTRVDVKAASMKVDRHLVLLLPCRRIRRRDEMDGTPLFLNLQLLTGQSSHASLARAAFQPMRARRCEAVQDGQCRERGGSGPFALGD